MDNKSNDVPNPGNIQNNSDLDKKELEELKKKYTGEGGQNPNKLPEHQQWITHKGVSEADQLKLLKSWDQAKQSGDDSKFKENYSSVQKDKLLEFGSLAGEAVLNASTVIGVGGLARGAFTAGKAGLGALKGLFKSGAEKTATKAAGQVEKTAAKEVFESNAAKSIEKSGENWSQLTKKVETPFKSPLEKAAKAEIEAEKAGAKGTFTSKLAKKAAEEGDDVVKNIAGAEKKKGFFGKLGDKVGSALNKVKTAANSLFGGEGEKEEQEKESPVQEAHGDFIAPELDSAPEISHVSGGDSGETGESHFGSSDVSGKSVSDILAKIYSMSVEQKDILQDISHHTKQAADLAAKRDEESDISGANAAARAGHAHGGGGGGGGFFDSFTKVTTDSQGKPTKGLNLKGLVLGSLAGGLGLEAVEHAEEIKDAFGEKGSPKTHEAIRKTQEALGEKGSPKTWAMLGKAKDWFGEKVEQGKKAIGEAAGFKSPEQKDQEALQYVLKPTVERPGLGSVAAHFESGGKAGAISSGKGDFGGKSYGAFQLSSKTGDVDKFLKSSGYASQFEGLQVGTKEFDTKWKELAKSDEFADAQRKHAIKEHYDPQMKKLQKAGIDLSQHGAGVQEALMSTANQYGANTGAIKEALKGKDVSKMSDSEVINAIQDYKASTVETRFKSSSEEQRAGVSKRIEQERKMLLGIKPGENKPTGEGSKPQNVSSKEDLEKQMKEIDEETKKIKHSQYDEKGIMKDPDQLKESNEKLDELWRKKQKIVDKLEPIGEKPQDTQTTQQPSATAVKPSNEELIQNRQEMMEHAKQKGLIAADEAESGIESGTGRKLSDDEIEAKKTEAQARLTQAKQMQKERDEFKEKAVQSASPVNRVGDTEFQSPEESMKNIEKDLSVSPVQEKEPTLEEAQSKIPAPGPSDVENLSANMKNMMQPQNSSPNQPQQSGATAPTAGKSGKMMKVRDDDPVILQIQYGNIRTS